jgi:hypothetical protein
MYKNIDRHTYSQGTSGNLLVSEERNLLISKKIVTFNGIGV